MCRIVIEITNHKVMKVVSDSHCAKVVVIDNDTRSVEGRSVLEDEIEVGRMFDLLKSLKSVMN